MADQQAFLAHLVDVTTSSAASSTSSTTSSSSPTATGALTCSSNSVSVVPVELIETTGNITPNQLLYTLRQVLCTILVMSLLGYHLVLLGPRAQRRRETAR